MDTLLQEMIVAAEYDPGAWTDPATADSGRTAALVVMSDKQHLQFSDKDTSFEAVNRFANGLAATLANIDVGPDDTWNIGTLRELFLAIDKLVDNLQGEISERIQRVVGSDSLRELEASWRSLDALVQEVSESDSREIIIDFIDADKEILRSDFEDHSTFVLNSALFQRVYVDEYDRYGGKPFGAMIGLFEFDSSTEDIAWLRTMSDIASNSHCPFIAAASPQFFGEETWQKLALKEDVEELMNLPRFGEWAKFRLTHAAAYIGLTLPRFLLRAPYKSRGKSDFIAFDETVEGANGSGYLWGNAAVLFARNMIRSFATSGWCQHVAGPRGGGMLEGLPVHTVVHHGVEELQPPVQIEIPDYRELQFANAGFIPLVHSKGSANATFFSARSVKKALEFEEDLATKNADLVTNLSYTLSITRIAHYVKRMVREYIGSTADAPYIQAKLEEWLVSYVTTAVNPDDLTLRYFPFKAMSVVVEPKPGPFGWYNCIVSVLPHIQFQGMDVELRLEAALGG
jgi:type VI secretion system protein ImpC